MAWIAGADGCPRGWFRAARSLESGELRFDAVESASELLSRAPTPRVLAIDIPIGLTESGPRECDREARLALGRPRASSVFPAPLRCALGASSHAEASALTQARDGRRVSAQAWWIFPKIREVDVLLRASLRARRRIREVHPEVSFWAWTGGRPMAHAKRTPAGRRARLALVEGWLGRGVLSRARGCHPKQHVADDDILDAIAALWTASRIEAGESATLPGSPPKDSAGLPMRIVY